MARYGENFYGTVKYGTTTRSGLTWALEVDWLGSGSFTGYNEATNMISLTIKRGRDNLIKSDGKGFEPIREGSFQAKILNVDGRYNPNNPTSPLYNIIAPNRNFRLRVKDDSNGTIYPIMIGQIDDIRPIHEDVDKVIITGSDKLRFFKNVTPLIDLQQNLTRDSIYPQILENINWTDGSTINSVVEMPEQIPYFWASEKNAFDLMKEIADSCLGNIFIANDGQFKFIPVASSLTPDVNISGSEILTDYSLLQPWDLQRNTIDVVVNNIGWFSGSTPANAVTVWKYENGSLFLPVATSKDYYLKLSYNNMPVILNQRYVPSGSIIFTSGSDGSGSSLSAGLYQETTSYGYLTKLHLANITWFYPPTADGYLINFVLNGYGWTKRDIYILEQVNQSSIDKYGRKEFVLDNDWIQEPALAQFDANILSNFFNQNLISPTIKILNNYPKQFLDLFDKVKLSVPDLYITDSTNNIYYVGSIQHDWVQPNGDIVVTTLKLEPIIQGI